MKSISLTSNTVKIAGINFSYNKNIENEVNAMILSYGVSAVTSADLQITKKVQDFSCSLKAKPI